MSYRTHPKIFEIVRRLRLVDNVAGHIDFDKQS